MNRKSLFNHTESGFSLVEAAIATVLVSAAALMIFPIVLRGKTTVRQSDFHNLCMNAVRSKLTQLQYSVADSVAGGVDSESDTPEVGAGSTMATGFATLKDRYNQSRAYCPTSGLGDRPAVVTEPPWSQTQRNALGKFECVVSRPSATNTSGCIRAPDQQLRAQLPGFEMYVNLRRVNPNIYDPLAGRFGVENCPADSSGKYDFQAAGDRIKITVTGVLPLTGNQSYAGIRAGSPQAKKLTCQVSSTVLPYVHLARYWMQTDHRIYRWIGTGDSGTGTSPGDREVFPSIFWGGNLGFVVSPDNSNVIVLQPGKLISYTNCGYSVSGGIANRLDCSPTSKSEYFVDSNIISIAGVFLDRSNGDANNPVLPVPLCAMPRAVGGRIKPVLMGLLSEGRGAVCLDLTSVADGGTVPSVPNGAPGSDGQPRYTPFDLANAPASVEAILMDPSGATAYFSAKANTGSTSAANSTYGKAIYDARDVAMRYPLEAVSVRAIAFSK